MALRHVITVKASHHRDESCNDYTLTREFVHTLHTWTGGVKEVKDACRQVIADYIETYPHRGRDAGTPFLDATVRENVDIPR